MEEPAFDVVAVVGSAGGVESLATVLRSLPPDFPAPVVVLQHLSDQGRALAAILRRRIRLPVGWAAEGQRLQPGEVLLCPPASGMVVLPDGTVSIVPSMRPQDRPCDVLLESLAETHGGRILAVVLAGSGRDGAAGARAVKAAGGTVVAQGEAVPTAAVAAGAVDLVLALDEIGPLLVDVVGHGARPPESSDEATALDRVFVGGSDTAAHLRRVDWSATPLGPVGAWPASLAAAVRTMLDNPLPVIVHWGPELVVLPNDASRRLLGPDFARVVGRPLRDAWPDDWATNGPVHTDVLETGRPRVVEDAPFTVNRREMFLTSALTALRGDHGGLAGTMSTAIDTTEGVLGRRQDDLGHRLQAEVGGAATVAEAAERGVAVLESDPGLVPFALVYLLDGTRRRAQLTASTGLPPGTSAAPRTVALADDDNSVWPLDTVARFATPAVVDGLADRLPGLRAGPYPEPPPGALVLPLRLAHDERPTGVLVLGLSARRPLDAAYRAFLDQLGTRLAVGLTDARARQHERGRQEALAEVDRAKTEFFANVSHEFRTPLTLLLGPLEAALAGRDALPPAVAADLDLAHRGAVRLLRMVQSLLDFSQVEVGRRRGSFEATDLSALTRELVGVFGGAADAAGLRLIVDCPPLPEPVFVDRVMWERIVSNLLSNALKFTLRGHVTVTLRLLPSHAELVVADTGAGIPDSELAHVFERFHRVEGVPARTREGTGIGLSLVDDLVRLHHGRVRVRSRLGEGSTFTVWVPRGRRADADSGIATGGAPGGAGAGGPDPLSLARSHADEALGWSAHGDAHPTHLDPVEIAAQAPWARVLVVDDNADLRTYLGRLLGRHWKVDVAADGAAARTRLASASLPDLLLVDVMMPGVDGLTLVQEVRSDPRLRHLPVILLSARAGDDATVAGLEAGADDYVVKPFSARELVARVGAQLELAHLRGQRDKAVRTGDERLQFALEASGFVAFEWDTATNHLTFLGGDGPGLFGVAGGDIAELVDVVHEDDLAVHLALLDRTLTSGEPYANEHRIRRPDGDVRWIRSVAHRLPDAPRRLFGVAMDVTDRHTADERLAEATGRLQADVEMMARFQALTSRLTGRSDRAELLEEILEGVVELQGADGGTVGIYDPDTGALAELVRLQADEADEADEDDGTNTTTDSSFRVLQPDSVGTESIPLVDGEGRPLGVLTTHTRHPHLRSDLELRLAELYVRQAVGLVAVRSGAAAAAAPAEEAAEEAADRVEEGDDQALADAGQP